MRQITVMTARAETILAAAQRGGVAVHAARDQLDQAVAAQIELEALVHTFAVQPGGSFARVHSEGVKHARAAVRAGRAALKEIEHRRRGLVMSLVIVFLVLIGLGLKIRARSRPRRSTR